MSSSIFQDSTLFISARSPFARRVRVAFHENGIRFQERLFDVFRPNPELWKANPLARVPALILKDGRVLIDSSLILQALYDSGGSPFMPREQAERLECYHWSAISLGICEKVVEYYLETLRPEPKRDPEIFEEVEGALTRSLTALEERLARSGSYLLGEQPLQADFDAGTALAYLRLRHPLVWQGRFEGVAAFLARLDARSSFEKTAPPPA